MSALQQPTFYTPATAYFQGLTGPTVPVVIPWVTSFDQVSTNSILCVLTLDLSSSAAGMYVLMPIATAQGQVMQWKMALTFGDISSISATQQVVNLITNSTTSQTYPDGNTVWRNGHLQSTAVIAPSPTDIWIVAHLPASGSGGTSTLVGATDYVTAAIATSNLSVANAISTVTTTANAASTAAATASSSAATALTTANTAITNAGTALTTANTAATAATTAGTTATTAATNASTALSTATTAASTASTALTNANTASTNASNASTTANTALVNANTAATNASTALTNANNAGTAAATAQTTANTALTNAATAATAATAAQTTANAAQTTVANKQNLPQNWTGTTPALTSGTNPVPSFGSNAFIYTGAGGATLDGNTFQTGDLALFVNTAWTKVVLGGGYVGAFASGSTVQTAYPAASNVMSTALVAGVPWIATATAWGVINTTALAALTDITSYDLGTNNTSVAAIKATANAALPASQKGAANGVASLDGTGKVPLAQLPATVLGALNYQGTYNATTNTPAIVAGNKGFYWTVATAGTSLGFSWFVGDKVVDNGTAIEKIDGVSSEVLTVGGQTPGTGGNVVLALANLSDGAAQQAAITGAANATNLTSGTLPAARLPAPSATTLGGVQSVVAVLHQYVTSVSTAGVHVLAQPVAADLSDLAATITTPIANAQTTANAAIPSTQKGAVNGVASLDGTGKVPAAQLPAASASTLAALTDIGSYDLGSNNTSVTAIKTTANAAATASALATTNTNVTNNATAAAAAQTTANAAIPSTQKGAANGVASLDGTGKVPVGQLPAVVLGALNYQGTYNASTNTPAIVAGNKGFFWTVATAGTSLGFNWFVGDKVVDNGTAIEKIDGVASEVLTVGGQTPGAGGNVLLALANLSDGAAQQTAITGAANASNLSSGTVPAARLPVPSSTTLGGVQSAVPVANQFVTGISVAGVPTTAQPSAANVTGLAASATTDTTNAANISSGTLPASRLPAPSATTLGGVQSALPVTNQFVTGISVAGVPSTAQPASSNLSDFAASIGTPIANAQATANAAIPTTQKGVTGGVAPNGDTVQITANVVISVGNANAATYNGKVLEFTGAFSVTLGAGLPNDFGFACIPPVSGNASIISDGTTTFNGATTTITRSAASYVMFAVTQRSTNRNAYVVN